jgi:predicted TPR repeat methyltransferase
MLNKFQIRSIEAFNNSAEKYANTIGCLENYNHCYDAMISLMNNNDRILDLACGPGNVSKYIRSKRNVIITGYDLAESMLILAKKNVPDAEFIQQSIVEFEDFNKYDWIINAFGFPFLDKVQRKNSLKCCSKAIKNDGFLYLSFMDGTKEGFEKPFFTENQEIYFYYHNKHEVLDELKMNGFELINEWEQDFDEGNGVVLKDVVLILKKTA